LCVGLGGGVGDVIVSTDPTGGGQSWKVEKVDTSSLPCGGNHPVTPTYCAGALGAISCASRSLCVAVDSNGNAVISTDPGGGVATWDTQAIDPDSNPSQQYDPLQFISCPSASLCVAADFVGNILSTREPAAANPWNIAAVTSSYGFLGDFACPAAKLCIGIDNNEAVLSRDAASPVGAWKTFPIGLKPRPAGYTAGDVTCVSSTFCAADDGGSTVAISTKPASGTTAWKASRADPRGIDALACASTFVCVAADALGDLTTGKKVR
jgi:hypothetical protein